MVLAFFLKKIRKKFIFRFDILKKCIILLSYPAPFVLMQTVLQESAHVAQLVEHVLGKDEVTGSIPVVGSSFSPPGDWLQK